MKKKILNLFILGISLFIGINSVKASFEVGDKVNLNSKHGTHKEGEHSFYNYSGNYSDLTYKGLKYQAVVYQLDNTYVTYCLDANKNGNSGQYTVKSILEESDSEKEKLAAKGVLAIIRNGYNDYTKTIPDGLSEDDFYLATGFALRVFYAGIKGDIEGNLDKGGLTESYIRYGINWFLTLDSESKDLVDKINDFYSKGDTFENVIKKYGDNLNFKNVNFECNGNGNCSTQNTQKIVKVANDLLKKAIEAMAVKDEDITIPKVTKSKVIDNDNYMMFSYTISNFDETGSIKINTPVCTNCDVNQITIGAGEVGYEGHWHPLTENTDITDYVNSKGTVWVRYKLTKEICIDRDLCKSGKITIREKIDYGANFDYEAYSALNWETYLIGKTGGGAEGSQRFVAAQKKEMIGGGSEKLLEFDIKCKKNSCDTKISTPLCTDDKDDAVATVTAPEDVKTCILENVDDAGNNYKLDNDYSVDNDYCSIFCKEDYEELRFNPIIKNINCGGWFTLTAHIEGKKSCYTSGNIDKDYAIDEDKFNEDVKNLQSQIANALTKYNMYKAWTESTSVHTEKDSECCSALKQVINTVRIGSYTKYDVDTTGKLLIKGTAPSQSIDFKTNCNCGSCSSTNSNQNNNNNNNDSSTKACCPGASCQNESEAEALGIFDEVYGEKVTFGNYKTVAANNMAYYENLLIELNKKLEETITDYNFCTTGWENKFGFAQKIKYGYEQYYKEEGELKHKDFYYSLLEEEEKYLESKEGEAKLTIEVCKGNTDNEYEKCSTGWVEIDDESTTEKYGYASTYDSVFKEKAFSLCEIVGNTTICKEEKIPLSEAKFVRKVNEKEADYTTPTIMQQIDGTGFITVDKNYNGNDVGLTGVKNGLAVSTRTVGGGITSFTIYGLGEFYTPADKNGGSDGPYGRLIDFDGFGFLINNTVAKVLNAKWNTKVGSGDIGEYYCKFESICRPSDCPDCNFECKPYDDPLYPVICGFELCDACKFNCVNCVFNLDDLQLNFKNISPNNFNNAGRDLGYNWSVYDWQVNTNLAFLKLLSQKAKVTISEITEANETIYDPGDKTNTGSNLGFSIRLTPNIVEFIKKYNEDLDDNGRRDKAENTTYNALMGKGYANDSLVCYSDEEKGFGNIYCFSRFMDELIDKYSDEVLSDLSKRTNIADRKDNPNLNNYWTLWIPGNNGVPANEGYITPTCSETDPDYPNCHVNNIGGPAWK